jgi:hypothetical protein
VTPGKAPVLLPRQRALPPAKQRLNHKAAQFFKYQKLSMLFWKIFNFALQILYVFLNLERN